MTPENGTAAALRSWRDGLVNLDAGNRMINYRRSETGAVEIAGPPPQVIVGALRAGGEHGFAGEGEFFRTRMSAQPLGNVLRRLMRKSRQDFLDRGVDALHLAIGMLHWRDEEDAPFAGPLLLLPVELTAAATTTRWSTRRSACGCGCSAWTCPRSSRSPTWTCRSC